MLEVQHLFHGSERNWKERNFFMRGSRKCCQRESNFDNRKERTFLSCADPPNVVRGGQILTTFFFSLWGEGGSKYLYWRAMIGPPEKRHSMAFRWRHDDSPTLVSAIFQDIRTCIARKSYIFVMFQGVRTHCPPLDPNIFFLLFQTTLFCSDEWRIFVQFQLINVQCDRKGVAIRYVLSM